MCSWNLKQNSKNRRKVKVKADLQTFRQYPEERQRQKSPVKHPVNTLDGYHVASTICVANPRISTFI
jgi:hypothetical protein